jgi:GNAT superfamily N-acetyltransferase
MKLVRWTRFTWNLKKLPETAFDIGAHYCIRPFNADEETGVRKIIHSSFALDPSWNDALNGMRPLFQAALDGLFEKKTPLCLALTHGSRVIGASLMTTLPSADNHLVSGPCVSAEYRNRGLGTALLYHSLRALRDAGLDKACGITKQNLAAARFVYTKFNSTSEPCEFSLGLAETR